MEEGKLFKKVPAGPEGQAAALAPDTVHNQEDLALAQRFASEGGAEEMGKWWMKHYPRFKNIAIRILGSKYQNAVEDVIQNSFLLFMQYIKDFEGRDDASLLHWANKIVRNTAIMSIRKSQRINLHELQSNFSDDERSSEGSIADKLGLNAEERIILKQETDLKNDLLARVIKFAPTGSPKTIKRNKKIINLWRKGLSHKQISEALDGSDKLDEGGVKAVIQRARKYIKAYVLEHLLKDTR